MRELDRLLKIAKKAYDTTGLGECDKIRETARHAVAKIASETSINYISTLHGKHYSEFRTAQGKVSRPFLAGNYINDPSKFVKSWNSLTSAADSESYYVALPQDAINKTLYTAISAFSACWDRSVKRYQ